MLRFKSISTELTVIMSLSLGVLLVLVQAFFINNTANRTRAEVETGLTQALRFEAASIESFIDRHGTLVETMVASPQFLHWFSNYREREKDLTQDPEFPRLLQLFKNLANSDEAIKAVFMASAITGEYFDSANGRYVGDGTYYATKRPWWKEATDKDRLFITQPEVDYVDKTTVSSIKKTVYSPSGELIGVAGVDILLKTLEEEVGARLKYHDQGDAFIINRDGRIILFPEDKSVVESNSDLAQIDRLVDGASGFSELKRVAQNQDAGVMEVSFKGTTHLAAFNKVRLDSPEVDWVAGILISEEVITTPVKNAIWKMILASLAIIGGAAGTIWLVSMRIVNPLRQVLNAMTDVAKGERDLTKRLDVLSENEVGKIAERFNSFIDNIHALVQANKEVLRQLRETSNTVSTLTQEGTAAADRQRDAVNMVATAAEELSYSVNSVADSTQSANQNADEANAQANKGLEVVNDASTSIKTLAQTVNQASEVVQKLNEDSSKIGEVLGVIGSIAEQTNLLALNAAIEAARAGEQGRGFAVVADEVRSLANRTQESTESIKEIIAGLQASADQAANTMELGTKHADQGVEKTTEVQNVLGAITHSIESIRRQSTEIASSTQQQAKAAGEITQSAASIQGSADDTAQKMAQVLDGMHQQNELVEQLNAMLEQYQV